MRLLPEFNPGNFSPTEAQAALILERQAEVKQYCNRDTLRSPGFGVYSDSSGHTDIHGVLYAIPMMLAKASMIDKGKNLLDHWHWFRTWLGTPWRLFMGHAYEGLWVSVSARMVSQFYAVDYRGSLLAGTLWIPLRVRSMATFNIISNVEALFWLGESQGVLPHENHPLGTLVNLPRDVSVAAGGLLHLGLHAMFGLPPYTVSMGVPRPTWASLNAAAIGRVFLRPPANVEYRDYSVPVIATDANGETSEVVWTVTVTPVSG